MKAPSIVLVGVALVFLGMLASWATRHVGPRGSGAEAQMVRVRPIIRDNTIVGWERDPRSLAAQDVQCLARAEDVSR
jgi:hypothetical protein